MPIAAGVLTPFEDGGRGRVGAGSSVGMDIGGPGVRLMTKKPF